MGRWNEQAYNRGAAAVVTQRHVRASTASTIQPWSVAPENTIAENELDTNADTCCLGKNFIVLQSTYWTADVYAYDKSIQPIENVQIVTAATAYNDVATGNTLILVFNESLYQISYGIPLCDIPHDPDHDLSIEVNADLVTVRAYGTKVGFTTRVPTPNELRNCQHDHVTSPYPWNPSDVVMVQATDQGGQRPWKRLRKTFVAEATRYEYLDPSSDEA
jgi:hypothetical protein